MRAFLSSIRHERTIDARWEAMHFASWAEREARAILAETEAGMRWPDGERWDLTAFTPGCFRYHFPGAAACGNDWLLDAPAALADALRAFVED